MPPKVEYALTDFGRSLEPILEQLIKIGEHYISLQDKEDIWLID
ncbi:winged helix-turn-helix transcriptional regulator [Paenibacillus humicus]